MSKKLIIAIIVLGVILIGGVYAYLMYFKTTGTLPTFSFKSFPPTEELPPAGQPPQQTVTEEKRGVLSTLVQEPVLAPTLARDGAGVVYILRENGNIYRITFDGKEKSRISNTTIIGAYRAVWSPDLSKVFLAYEQDAAVKKLILDISGETPRSFIIPQTIVSARWSQNSKTFTFLEPVPGGTRLVAASATGQSGREQMRIPLGDAVMLPNKSASLFFGESPSGLVRSPLFALQRGTFKELTNGFGLSAAISPSEEKALIGTTDASGSLQPLQILSLKDGSLTGLGIRTLAEKCAWSGENTLFCGIPVSLPDGAVLPDDYDKGVVSLSDQLVKIDLTANTVTRYAVQGYDIADIFADTAGQNVFFRDRNSDFLYRFSLP